MSNKPTPKYEPIEIGKKYGKLTVVAKDDSKIMPSGRIRYGWICNCDCGKSGVYKDDYNLKTLKNPNCGCLNKYGDLTGKRFGRLTVVSKQGKMWVCDCDCGTKGKLNQAYSLMSGAVVSCGCYLKEKSTKHGKSTERLFHIWRGIIERCYNPQTERYSYYGGRNITVIDEWRGNPDGFLTFYNWAINNGYKKDLTIDRINNDGNYEPNNCKWSTNIEQANNRRTNSYITFKQTTKTLADWCRDLNISYKTTWNRIKRGWSIEEAFTFIEDGRKVNRKLKDSTS